MATVKKGTLTGPKSHCKHLRNEGKKSFWKAERRATKHIKQGE